MRYVDPERVNAIIPPDWYATAATSAEAVRVAKEEDRKEEIKQRSEVWRGLKPLLKEIMNGKCWYCESLQCRSDNAVDHFRPKNRVHECKLMKCGYWWLAFKWQNFRFACTFCNSRRIDQNGGTSGGKHDHFPLSKEASRAVDETCEIGEEPVLLLDPCDEADPPCLWFDEDGQVRANPDFCGPADSFLTKRVEVSVNLYHLDQVDLVERRRQLCNDIRNAVEKADSYLTKYQNGDSVAKNAYRDKLNEIRELLGESREYSATARSMLLGLRGRSQTANAITRSL
jgi:uncharacterized protein (TIGR02646 family)